MADETRLYCKDCSSFISDVQALQSHKMHNVIPQEWVKTCGNCNNVIETEWSYCAFCGQKFGDW